MTNQSLQNPYKAKNARFDSLEELLLVKGVTADILYGNRERKGVIDFLTVYTKKSKININAAPREVLMAIPGMTPELADGKISIIQQSKIIADLFHISYFWLYLSACVKSKLDSKAIVIIPACSTAQHYRYIWGSFR